MSFFETKETAFGLDISERNLRLIQLKKRGKKIVVQSYNEIKLPPQCLEEGEIKQPQAFLNSLHKLTKTKQGRGRLSAELVGVLPERKTFLKLIELAPDNNTEPEKSADQPADIEKKIKKILPEHIPIDIDNAYIDWQLIKECPTGQTVLIGACPQNIIDSYVDIFSQANLIPTILEIEAAAIARVAITEDKENDTQIIIDIGANRTGLFLYDQGVIKFTITLPISGNQTTQMIMETLDFDFDKAEKAKIVCGLDRHKCRGALLEVFAETIDQLQSHIQRAIDYYQSNFYETSPVSQIMLCGGGSNFINIAEIIQEKTQIKTVNCDPWHKIKNPNPRYFTPQKSQSFITALGLALRGIDSKNLL